MAEAQVEICLFWGNWQIQQWWSCMTRSEWAAWAQALAVLFALFIPAVMLKMKRINSLKHSLQFIDQFRRAVNNLNWHVQQLDKDIKFSTKQSVVDLLNTIRPISFRPEFLASLSVYDNEMLHRILIAIDDLEETKQIIRGCAESNFFDSPDELVKIAYANLYRDFERFSALEKELEYLRLIIYPKDIYPSLSFINRIKYIKDRIALFIRS
jgi:UDP-glucose 6-dehydrogenase